MERSENEELFIREYARKLMVRICDQVARDGEYEPVPEPYFEILKKRGWLSKKENHLPTEAGWKVATAFLKR